MQLTITQATSYKEKKDGSPLIDKHGKPYMRAVIKTREHGDTFLSGFVYHQLKEGDTIDAEVKEEEYMGKKQLKFQIQSAKKQQEEAAKTEMVFIKRSLEALQTSMKQIVAIQDQILGELHNLAPLGVSKPKAVEFESPFEDEHEESPEAI